MLYLGSDHRGFALKERIKAFLDGLSLPYEDLGNLTYDALDDYPDFAKLVAEKVAENPSENRGILICASGIGMDIAANRHKGARSALAWNVEVAKASRRDDDTNVLSLGADFLDSAQIEQIIDAWLHTESLKDEKYIRRIQKLDA